MKKINLKKIYNKINNKISTIFNKKIITTQDIKQFFNDKKIKIKNIARDNSEKIKSFFQKIFNFKNNMVKKENNKLSIEEQEKQFKKNLGDEVSKILKQKKEEKKLNKNTNNNNIVSNNNNIVSNNNNIVSNNNNKTYTLDISNIKHYTRLVDERVKILKKEGKTTEEIVEYLSPTARDEFIKREELINKNRERKEYLTRKYGTALEGLTNNINKSIEAKQRPETTTQNTITVLDDDSVESMGVINNFDVNNAIDVDDYVVVNTEEGNASKNKVKQLNKTVKKF